jgi:methionyl-tRNA synthetase
VWLHEYLEDFKGKEDVLRYVLTANMPETKDNDFTWKDFQARNNNELVAILGNFVNRVLVLTNNYYGGLVPSPGNLTDYDRNSLTELSNLKTEIEKSIDNFRFREALKLAMDMARLGNKYLADSEPWKIFKSDPERVKTIMNISVQITANLTIAMDPFLPTSMEKLRGLVNIEKLSWNQLGRTDLLSPGHKVKKPELLFEKIEDDLIQKQVNKLLETKKTNQMESVVTKPAKENIEYDDFAKLDIRIGTVVTAEKVAKTKKLLKLTIETGIDTRTVVSGIAEYYEPEEVIGKQVAILVNLAPKNLRGIESQGMILMAENSDGYLVFVSPTVNIKNGSEVK